MRRKKPNAKKPLPGKTVKKSRSSRKKTEAKPQNLSPPVHPWRVCPYGEYWVRTHPLHVPPSKTHPEGSVTTRHEHCARNPSGKDQLYPEEIQEIANQNFSGLKNKPCPLPSKFGAQGSKYDRNFRPPISISSFARRIRLDL